MTYSVKEIFYTLQGEGAHSGRPAVFCRFAGCNLWSGLEADRSRAICSFCDTDFVGIDGPGGGKFRSAQDLAQAVRGHWPNGVEGKPFVVCTGGEPLLQLDEPLVAAFHDLGFEVAVETNGTQKAPADVDWICVSPKASAPIQLASGHELKLVFPQETARPEKFESLDFQLFYLQPMDGPDVQENTRQAIDYCKANPRWRLSIQSHKLLGIP